MPSTGSGEQAPLKSEKTIKTAPYRKWLYAVILVSAMAAAGYGWIAYHRGRVSTDDAQVDGHIIPVASKIYGSVAEVLVTDNEQVRAGQVLVRIDGRDYQTRIDQAKAALALSQSQAAAAAVGVPLTRETTRSSIGNFQAQLEAAEAECERAKLAYQLSSTADIRAAEASIEALEANSERAQADLERMRPLLAKEEISKQQFDAVQSAARVAASELKAAREKLDGIRQDAEIKKVAISAARSRADQARAALETAQANLRQTEIREVEVVSAKAGIAQAQANLQAAELQKTYTEILAPEDGVVTKKMVEAGQIVQGGQSLLIVVPLHKVWVTANFKETQLARVRPGQKAHIEIDMYDRRFSGKVDSMAGATGARLSLLPPENATGNFVKIVQRIPVKILVDPSNDDAVLRPGMNVVATIFTDGR